MTDELDILDAMDGEEFIPEEEDVVESGGGYILYDPGWYVVEITEPSVETRKDDVTKTLQLKTTILNECDYKDKKMVDWIQLNNFVSKKQEGYQKRLLATLGQACEIEGRFAGSSQIVGKFVAAYIVIEEGTGDYKDKNKFTDFKPVDAWEELVEGEKPVKVEKKKEASKKEAPVKKKKKVWEK